MAYDMERFYDAVIIGGGPAGLTAGIYLARARYRVLIIEKEEFGGQITITAEVVNYPGVGSTSGRALTETMRRQAQSFGAEFLSAEVTGLTTDGDVRTIHTTRGDYHCFGILLATGAHPRMVGFQGEKEHRGRGVAYCATCDGEFFTGKDIFVIGGGFAAAEESVFLTKYARHVTILMVTDDFTCAKATADETRRNEKISVIPHVAVESVEGENGLKEIRWKDLKTGEETSFEAAKDETFGVFVFAGYEPATELVKNIVELNPQGYVVTDRNCKTSVDGIYAAGDVCEKNLRQVVTAVGDGALAATELEKYAHALQAKTGLHPKMETSNAHGLNETEAQRRPAAAGDDKNGDDRAAESASGSAAAGNGLFSADIVAQLQPVFAKMSQPLILKLYLDERPVSRELKGYMDALAALTDKLSVQTASPEEVAKNDAEELPFVRVCRAGGNWSGLAFHGVPGGHEFTSFVLGLYNAAGPGQSLDAQTLDDIQKISKTEKLQIIVSLSCTMCPELVTAAQRIASENPNVTADVYDINHFPHLREKYQVMSVPCMVVNQDKVSFGKKNVRQILELLAEG